MVAATATIIFLALTILSLAFAFMQFRVSGKQIPSPENPKPIQDGPSANEIIKEIKRKKSQENKNALTEWNNKFNLLDWSLMSEEEQTKARMKTLLKAKTLKTSIHEADEAHPWLPTRQMLMDADAEWYETKTVSGEVLFRMYNFCGF